jgi:exonuclease III
MKNVDMVYWGVHSSNPEQLDLFIDENAEIKQDELNSYTTSFMVNSDDSVTFRSTRPLSAEEAQTFVIELDTPYQMVAVSGDTNSSPSDIDVKDYYNWALQIEAHTKSERGKIQVQKLALKKY